MISRIQINPVYYDFLEAQQRIQIFFGGSSGGKSKFVADRTVRDILETDRNYLVVRNTATSLKGSTFNEINKAIDDFCGPKKSEIFTINKTDKTFINKLRGNGIYMAGLDDVEKLKSVTPIKGVFTDLWAEEATEDSEEDIGKLFKRFRGLCEYKKRFIFSFNPILRSHWIFKKYFAGRFDNKDNLYADDDLLILKTTYKDNVFLSSDDIDALENETNKYLYDVYTLGNWGVLGNLIFTNWEVKELSDIKKTADNYFNGLDFGYSNDPLAFTRMHYDKKRKRLYILDEFGGREWSDEYTASRLKPLIGKERITVDHSEPKSRDELKRLGVNAASSVGGPDSINFGVKWLQDREIFIDRGCQETVNEFQQYQWKKDKYGDDIPKPIDKHNHYIDSIRYAMESEMKPPGFFVYA